MAAEQHFNNFMIVVSGSHKERERKIEGSRRGEGVRAVCGVVAGSTRQKLFIQIKCFFFFYANAGCADGGLDDALREPPQKSSCLAFEM